MFEKNLTKEIYDKIDAVLDRAEKLNILKNDRLSHLMDIEVAYKVFELDFDRWLDADDFNFTHDFVGIYGHINREKAYNCENCTNDIFSHFVPRYGTFKIG